MEVTSSCIRLCLEGLSLRIRSLLSDRNSETNAHDVSSTRPTDNYDQLKVKLMPTDEVTGAVEIAKNIQVSRTPRLSTAIVV